MVPVPSVTSGSSKHLGKRCCSTAPVQAGRAQLLALALALTDSVWQQPAGSGQLGHGQQSMDGVLVAGRCWNVF